MRIIYLDFETYYDKDYSLKKLSVEAYVRDARFAPIMLGYAVNAAPVSIADASDIKACLADLRLDAKDTFVVAQNYRFDGFILGDYYGIHPTNPICTRAMARWTGASRLTRESLEAQAEFFGVGDKGDYIHDMLGKHYEDFSEDELKLARQYCIKDVELLRENAKRMFPHMTPQALAFISMSLKTYQSPVFTLDVPRLEQYKETILARQRESQERIKELFPFDSQDEFLKHIRSKTKFVAMLEKLGASVPYKVSDKKTATRKAELEKRAAGGDKDAALCLETGAFTVMEPALAKKDLGFIELLTHPNPDVATLARIRAENNTSIAMSRCETFISIGRRGLLPVALEAYQAHTGRYTAGTSDGVKSDGANLQNLAKRTGDKTLRECVLAPDGYSIIACDSSQIEARVLAWLANQNDLLTLFREQADPYCHMAAAAYGVPHEEIYYWTKGDGAHDKDTSEDVVKKKAMYKSYRNVGKTMTLQLGYMSGAGKLALFMEQQGVMLKPTREEHELEAARLVKVYRSVNGCIRRFWRTMSDVLMALSLGQRGWFGGVNDNLLYYDGQRDVFGHRVPGIMLPDGYWILYPNLRVETSESGKPGYVYDVVDMGRIKAMPLHQGVATAQVTQGTAFALMRWQALQINKRYPVRVNIHDSWGVVVPDKDAENAAAYMEHCMTTLPEWAQGLPVACESEIGKNFTVV